MTNKLQITIIITLIVFSFSIIYSLVIRPYQSDKKLEVCLREAYNNNKNPQLQLDRSEICLKQYK